MTTANPQEKQPTFLGPYNSDWQKANTISKSDPQTSIVNDALHNTLMSALQMQNLVLLAGSGCSLSAGGPSMKRLWEETVGDPASNDAQSIADKVKYDMGDAVNLEEFLSKIEAYLQFDEQPKIRDYLNQCKTTILDLCTSFLNDEELHAHRTFLHRLSRRRVRDRRLKIFTTNYDLCFERTAGLLGNVVLDGFSFVPPRRYDPRYFDYDIVRRTRGEQDSATYLEGVFLLYKLHGSVNWGRSADGSIVEQGQPEPNDACLIYPAAGKYQQSYTQPYLESMAQYVIALREPNTCVVAIGFGFNDDHLSEPLLAAVQSNPYMRLIIVDPSAESFIEEGQGYRKRFAQLSSAGSDIWFVAAKFDDFANLVPDLTALSPGDALANAIQRIGRSP